VLDVAGTPYRPFPRGGWEVERRLQDMVGTYGAKQDIKRKASLEVPADLLKAAGTMRVHLAFENGAGAE